MCMLSAVVGVDQAALKLSRMTVQQEGLFGGYYTGICGLGSHGFVLHKCVGPHQALTQQGQISEMTGSSGLAHSRTNGGGGTGRAQPFIDHSGSVAGIGTGTHGVFTGPSYERSRQNFVDELVSSGVRFSSCDPALKGSAVLQDGSSVHNTEIATQGVAFYLQKGETPAQAIRHMVSRMPAEGAYVFLLRSQPERIYVANYNMRIVFCRQEQSVYLATSVLALPSVSALLEVPPNQLLELGATETEYGVLDTDNAFRLDCSVPPEIDETFLSYVKQHPGCSWADVVERGLMPLFSKSSATLLLPESFRVVERLCAAGLIRMIPRVIPGVAGGVPVPQIGLVPV
jgi:hypothetical protein